jgi:hypothetical protein
MVLDRLVDAAPPGKGWLPSRLSVRGRISSSLSLFSPSAAARSGLPPRGPAPSTSAAGASTRSHCHTRPLCEVVRNGSPPAIATATADFCSSIRKRLSEIARASFRKPAWPHRTRGAPPASQALPPGFPAPAPGAPACRPSLVGSPTRGRSAACPSRARRMSPLGSRCRPAPRAKRFRRQLQNVRFAIASRTFLVHFNRQPVATSRLSWATIGAGPASLNFSKPGFRLKDMRRTRWTKSGPTSGQPFGHPAV